MYGQKNFDNKSPQQHCKGASEKEEGWRLARIAGIAKG